MTKIVKYIEHSTFTIWNHANAGIEIRYSLGLVCWEEVLELVLYIQEQYPKSIEICGIPLMVAK